MFIGDYVRVIDQDITGYVVDMYGNTVVIEDEYSEFLAPDNRLEFRAYEVTKVQDRYDYDYQEMRI